VFATGFDAMTGAIMAVHPITGRGGKLLSDAWANGPKTYAGSPSTRRTLVAFLARFWSRAGALAATSQPSPASWHGTVAARGF
jgi:hypothetical protein